MENLRIRSYGSAIAWVPSLAGLLVFAALPGTLVPGFHIPPLRGWGNMLREAQVERDLLDGQWESRREPSNF